MLALIDGDIVAYRSAFAAERVVYSVYLNEDELLFQSNRKAEAEEFIAQQGISYPEVEIIRDKILAEPEVAKMAAKSIMENILKSLDLETYKLYLTGDGNFRHDIATIRGYKANRDPAAKPKYLEISRYYLTEYWNAEMVHGMEADDQMGIEQWSAFEANRTYRLMSNGYSGLMYNQYRQAIDTVICSIDKDLKMIPGWHYNFVKGEKEWISELEGYRNFYRQCITGDATDNIPGLFNITGRKATKAVLNKLEELKTVAELSSYVFDLYKGHEAELAEIAELLWILREPRDA